MAEEIISRLQASDLRKSKSDKILANYIERHMADLPFETAKSIAERVGVSQMTVGRYLRRLGFGGVEELKAEIRSSRSNSAWQIKGPIAELQKDAREGKLLAELVQKQIENLGSVYELTKQPQWLEAIETLLIAREVYIAAFQNVRGLAQYFAAQLSYIRPHVQFIDGLNGTYAELLDQSAKGRLLFLYDVRRFAAKARPLAIEARKAGCKVILLSDEFCPWSRDIADIVLIAPAPTGALWDGSATIASIFDLILSHAIVLAGEKVCERVETLTKLQDIFGDFEN